MIHHLKQTLEELKRELFVNLTQNGSIIAITHRLVASIDAMIITMFKHYFSEEHPPIAVFALGSYGRQELQLHSDIDLLILHDESISDNNLQSIRALLQHCWDIGLDISHQVTTISACANLAAHDISVMSSLIDIRLLCGLERLLTDLRYQTHTIHMWTSHDYFIAKQQEQLRRYKKYNETAYNLEPNIKYGPGGLRDLQTILTIGKRHFGIHNLADAIATGFITEKEHEELLHCQHFLMRVRTALHGLANRKEEQLLFDYQLKLSQLFGFTDNDNMLAIEQFMQHYFSVIKRSRDLNDMLLQWFNETIVHQRTYQLIPLDDTFQLSNQYIEVRHPHAFLHNIHALLQLFLWIAKRPDIIGVRASTIRLIREHRYLMTNQYCQSIEATTTFLAIFKTGNNPYPALQYMSQYGVLGQYLTCFQAVTGRMQYDLFHVYTVEQHTLFVIRNLARFNVSDFGTQFSLACVIMPNIAKPDILYLAGFFHDIAKGRGGNHSELGAIEAEQFAKQHHLNYDDTALLVWLVKHHLLMSSTIQRQDIYDPMTIEHFSNLLPKKEYLDYLYLLTVADICATNPTLWNSWKDSLLKELYVSTKQVLQQETTPMTEATLIKLRQEQAFTILLTEKTINIELVSPLWQHFKANYFLHEPPNVIAEQTKAILTCKQYPLILIMPHHNQGGTEVFIYMPHRDERFTIATTIFNNQHLTIQEANITTGTNQFDLDSYIVLNQKDQTLLHSKQTQQLHAELSKHFADTTLPRVIQKRQSRTHAHFNVTTQITYTCDAKRQYTCLLLITSDRPGLLARVGELLLQENIHLHHAKIVTIGERVEDTFYINNEQGEILTKAQQLQLQKQLIRALS